MDEVSLIDRVVQKNWTILGIKLKSAFKRGGNWNNTSNAGVFTLNLNNAPANSNTNIGFRCAQYFYNLARVKYLRVLTRATGLQT